MEKQILRQLTYDEAIAIYNGGEWRDWTDEEIVKFQLFQDRLCMPFDRFHQAIEAVLCRPVFTHEFAFHDRIVSEYLKQRPAPTMEEIFKLIPSEKLIVISTETGG